MSVGGFGTGTIRPLVRTTHLSDGTMLLLVGRAKMLVGNHGFDDITMSEAYSLMAHEDAIAFLRDFISGERDMANLAHEARMILARVDGAA